MPQPITDDAFEARKERQYAINRLVQALVDLGEERGQLNERLNELANRQYKLTKELSDLVHQPVVTP
jgi:type II secretory pathway component PulF